jgi:predicted GTPase/TM2 domain-containing membrane protein YozV
MGLAAMLLTAVSWRNTCAAVTPNRSTQQTIMVRLHLWQWAVLLIPIAAVATFLMIAAGIQIQTWGLNWIWVVIGLVFVGWRWLLVQWTRPNREQVEAILAELETAPLTPAVKPASSDASLQQAQAALQDILAQTRQDPAMWDDWDRFWQRCLSLIRAIAHIYNPQAQQPLLNIYVPQAYRLLRGTMNDLDAWMQRLTPVLNQVTIGQALQAYNLYQVLQPSVRRALQVWNWAQWLLNPAAAAARVATQGTRDRATQELLGNLNQLIGETLLRQLAQQAIALYSGSTTLPSLPVSEATTLPQVQTQTLRELLAQATPTATVAVQPVNLLLVGRTGAGKSSLINTLFIEPIAAVDALPSSTGIQSYHWQSPSGEPLILWDTPGYEQAHHPELRQQVLEHTAQADLVLLATPALDPALQMDVEFLQDLATTVPELPVIVVVTQVDRLRPLREWQPPYDWLMGERPKEIAIREAVTYRAEVLPQVKLVLPLVTAGSGRSDWGVEALSLAILEAIDPAKQQRLARVLQNLEARTVAAAEIIDRYTFQMTTQQGLATFLKSPVLRFLSTLITGSPTLAVLLAEKIPIEQLPLVIGKTQLAYDLYTLLNPSVSFDLVTLWPLLLDQRSTPDRNAWALGHALIRYWTQTLAPEQLQQQFDQEVHQAESQALASPLPQEPEI